MKKLHVDSVLKSYGEKVVLSDIFLECMLGEVVGLLGRNGCGKSTLLQIIFGSLAADQRFVRADGQQLLKVSDSIRHISYLPQQGLIPPYIKVKAAIELLCPKLKNDLPEHYPFLKALIKQKVSSLSHGEKRLLELILLINTQASYVLLDEPFNGVSPLQKEMVIELIRSKASEKGFIITDHDYHNILEVSTRLLIMFDGGLKPISNETDLEMYGYLPENRIKMEKDSDQKIASS
jgi:ABC-type multidrug transport system ATPase subunit